MEFLKAMFGAGLRYINFFLMNICSMSVSTSVSRLFENWLSSAITKRYSYWLFFVARKL